MSKKERIINELKNKKLSKKEVAENCNSSLRYVDKIIQKEKIYIELFKNQKEIQKLKDIQRIERKHKRDDFRVLYSNEKYLSEISKYIQKFELPELKQHKQKNYQEEYEGIFQLSDFHLNEIISDVSENSYDFDIAAKRLKKYINESIKIFNMYKIKKILIVMTGDMIGSNRRVDEKLNQATNRSKATIIGTFLLEQAIRELNVYFNIKIAMVCGNESRVYDIGDSDIVFSDNYDLMLYEMLKMIFRKNLDMFIDGVDENIYKKIIKINSKNILFLHGHNICNNRTENDIIKLKGQIAAINNIPLDYVIFGHIHNCQITDFYARSSSLCGGNAYSTNKLKLVSRASQNIHLISKTSIHSIKIDLHNTDNIIGYPLNNEFYINKKNEKMKKLIYRF